MVATTMMIEALRDRTRTMAFTKMMEALGSWTPVMSLRLMHA